jgi:signal transduction histidine kinase
LAEIQNSTLLIVDDNEATRYLLGRVLQTAGFQTIEAKNGETALQLVQQQPSLVLLDINLPDIDGFEVCRRIKANPQSSSIPVLQMSAYQTGSSEKVQGLEGGADGYLVHPIDNSVLIATIRALLRTHQAEEELRKAHDELELRVQERTRQLRQVNEDLQAEIARREKVEESLRVFAANLERSNRDLQDFASVVSHDLQEPLRSVRLFSERLQAEFADSIDENGQVYLTRILAGTGRMRQHIQDLLEVARVSSGAYTKPFTAVDLGKTVTDVLEILQKCLEESQAQVTVRSLPTLEADPVQMRQLFQNLIGNALKFQVPGQPPLIRIEGQKKVGEKQCQITVQDNGIGFDEKHRERIFGVFQRLHSRSKYDGSGIGLSICRKIVERHGGTITARSAPGQGTTFTVTLPLEQPAKDMAPLSGPTLPIS